MRVYQAFLFCLVSTISLSVFAKPNFTVRQEGQDLFIDVKDPAKVDYVIAKMKALNPSAVAITVYNHEEPATTFVQLYEYFFDDTWQDEGELARLEDMLEGVTRATERYIHAVPRLPYVPPQEEYDQRRAAHVARVVHMARNPEEPTRADILAEIQEHADVAIMPLQRQAVLGRLRPGIDATRADVDAMVRALGELDVARQRFIEERPAISVLQMLEAFDCEYAKFN